MIQKIAGSIFCLAFAGMGIAFLLLLVISDSSSFSSLFWSRTPCVILRAELPAPALEGKIDKSASIHVLFRYRWNNEEYTGDQLHATRSMEIKGNEAAVWLTRFKPGTVTTCWVNAKKPEQAALLRPSWAYVFMPLIPLLFVAVGIGGLIKLWMPPRKRRASDNGSVWMLRAFFGVFLLAGLGFATPLVLLPGWMILKARAWTPVPCVIEHSSVESSSSSDGSTYRVAILYRYEFDGREYRSNRYSFFTGSTSGRKSKAAVVRALPAGTSATCHVDPENPHEAVIHRGPTSTMFFGLIPAVFIVIGAGGMLLVGRPSGPRKSSRGKSSLPATRTNSVPATGSTTLRPSASPLGKLVGTLLIALFWNGIVSVFLVVAWKSWKGGKIEWLLIIFLIPFVLVGLGIIAGAGYYFLALFNPRVHLTLSGGDILPGSQIHIQWRIGGASGRIQRLRILLEGREEATYRRGTSTSTDRSVFAEIALFDSTDSRQIAEGRAQALIPAETMHSFASPNNRIVWTLKVHGSIPRFPDISDDYPITIRPRPAP